MLTGLPRLHRSAGLSLVEVLIAMLILSFGLLGLAVLQSKAQLVEFESYQRAQAVVLRDAMVNRIMAQSSLIAGDNTGAAEATYDIGTGNPVGTGDSSPSNCTVLAIGAPRDLCEWSNALKGAAEKDAGTNNVGAMVGARGCIELIQPADWAPGVCTPAIYRVSVAWQGLHKTVSPTLDCGRGQYGSDDSVRRLITAQIQVGLPGC